MSLLYMLMKTVMRPILFCYFHVGYNSGIFCHMQNISVRIDSQICYNFGTYGVWRCHVLCWIVGCVSVFSNLVRHGVVLGFGFGNRCAVLGYAVLSVSNAVCHMWRPGLWSDVSRFCTLLSQNGLVFIDLDFLVALWQLPPEPASWWPSVVPQTLIALLGWPRLKNVSSHCHAPAKTQQCCRWF